MAGMRGSSSAPPWKKIFSAGTSRINAIAWHSLTLQLRDPTGGLDDLANGILRAVGDPHERIREDRLRVLRALRFAGTLGLRIAPELWHAVRASSGFLHHLSAERIREELFKILRAVAPPSASLRLYESAGVLRELYPRAPGVRRSCRGFGVTQ